MFPRDNCAIASVYMLMMRVIFAPAVFVCKAFRPCTYTAEKAWIWTAMLLSQTREKSGLSHVFIFCVAIKNCNILNFFSGYKIVLRIQWLHLQTDSGN